MVQKIRLSESINVSLFLPLKPRVLGSHRTRHCKTFELKVAVVAEQVVAKEHLRPDGRHSIAAPDARAAAFWTFLRNHYVVLKVGSRVGQAFLDLNYLLVNMIRHLIFRIGFVTLK